MQLKAVIFDLDGTLYPNRELYWYSLFHVLRMPKTFLSYRKIRHEIRQEEQIDDIYLKESELLSLHLGRSQTECYEILQKNMYGTWLNVFHQIHLFEGVKETLETLRSQGFKTGLLSDFPLRDRLESLGISHYFDVAISSMDVNSLKPDSRPFLEILDRLQLKPEEACYVGNSYRYDVLGAQKIHMKTGHITKKRVKNSTADFSFKDYSEFLTKFKALTD